MKQFTATANDDGVRLSRFVQSVTRDFPTSLLYKSFRNKRVKVNGKKAAPEYRLQTGDLIELYINDEFFPPEGAKPVQKAAPKKQPNQPKVTVIYEDENLAVLYKPTHLLCHSDRTGDANLVDAFTQYLTQKGEYDPHGENRFKPGICNRLDRGTEGLVIAAKNYAALRDMNEIIRTDLLKKEYYTITVGIPQSGRFTAWWEHDEKNNKVSIHAHQSQDERRKQIITDVDVLRSPLCPVQDRPCHRAPPPDPCPSGLSGQAGAGRYQIRQPQDERAYRHQDAGTVRGAHQLSGCAGGKHPALPLRQGHQTERPPDPAAV